MTHDDPILMSRLDAINDAQKRTRLALIVGVFASAAIMAGLWNLYASWDQRFASAQAPATWGAQQVAIAQISAWVQNNTVGVSLLGIHLSTSDASVVGAVVLLLVALYHCFCARRENHEIGALLTESVERKPEIRRLIYLRIRAFMVFTPLEEDDAPYTGLGVRELARGQRVPFFGSIGVVLNYLPVITVAFIIATDIYYAVGYVEPYNSDAMPRAIWSTFSTRTKCWYIAMDIFASAVGVLVWMYCRHATAYREGITRTMNQFLPLTVTPSAIPDQPTFSEVLVDALSALLRRG